MRETGEYQITRTADGLQVDVTRSMMPLLSNWVGRLQKDLNRPFEIPEVVVTLAVVVEKLKERARKEGWGVRKISTETLYKHVKKEVL